MEKEIRNLGNIQIRAVDGESSRHIEGYALMFDTQSEYIGFYETIERGAVTQEMVDACDVFATFNHDMNMLAKCPTGHRNYKGTNFGMCLQKFSNIYMARDPLNIAEIIPLKGVTT